MKVILNRDVASLGEEGDIKEVAPGYARNYLLPQGMVLEYNDRNLAQLEQRQADIAARKQAKREAAKDVKAKLESEPLTITMSAGENGRLFGAVTTATIADALGSRGLDIERKRIELPEATLKSVGNYKVKIRLYGDEEATIALQVAATGVTETAAPADKDAEAQADPTDDEPVQEQVEPTDDEPVQDQVEPTDDSDERVDAATEEDEEPEVE